MNSTGKPFVSGCKQTSIMSLREICINYVIKGCLKNRFKNFICINRGAGCGGYVYDTGVISIQNFPTGYSDGTDCVWFLEAEQGENVILLKKVIAETNSTKLTNSAYLPIMTVSLRRYWYFNYSQFFMYTFYNRFTTDGTY